MTTCPARPQMRSRRRATKRTGRCSQSRSVRSWRWSAPAPGCRRRCRPAARRRPRRSARAAAGSRSGSRRGRRCAGSTSWSTPTAGSSSSRGSTISTQRVSWRAASWREGLVPGVAVRGSPTRRRPGPGGGTTRRAGGCRRRRSVVPRSGRGAVRMRWSRAIRWSLPAAGRDGHGAVGGEQHGAEAVAGAGGEEPDRGGGRDGQVALLAQRGAEVEDGGQVERAATSRARGRRSSRGRGAAGAGR